MEKNIEPVNFNASQELLNHIDEMFDDLDTYNNQIVSSDIFLESTNKSEEKDKKVKIKVNLPSHEIYVDEVAEDFVSAAQLTHDAVKRQLVKQKEKDKTNRIPRPDKP
jgi:putative sigma-54 modulation protein